MDAHVRELSLAIDYFWEEFIFFKDVSIDCLKLTLNDNEGYKNVVLENVTSMQYKLL